MSDANRPFATTSSRAFSARLPILALALASFACGLVLMPPGAQSAGSKPQHEVASRPHVYLMRGLMNIFSLGMDQLAAEIAAKGIAANVYNHTVADSVDAEIVAKYRAGDHGPYILIGHSLGADAVMQMAQQLDRSGVPVALVIPVDGTGSYAASGNVACVVNLTQRTYAYMRPGAGFHGRLANVNVSSYGVDHITIDKSPRVQAQALGAVVSAAHGESCRTGAAEPTVAKPATPAEPAQSAAKPAPPPGVRTGDAGIAQ
jgi:pimeloyl-ACP methyl ester carboxylesterase